MMVYHGSAVEVPKPDILHSRNNVDFGKGFYVTPMKEQAVKWAQRFRRHGGKGIVSVYEIDLEECESVFNIMKFDSYTEEWLDFITACRRSEDTSHYDLVIGGVANDKVFNTIELYFEGLIEKTEAIKRLCYEKPNLQICMRSQELINRYLKYKKSEEI